MLKKILRDAVVIVVGKQAEEIADLLNTQKHVNEFLIAKKLKITINQTRNILYKLTDNGLVSNIRKKDKKKGWYTYFWKIEALKSLEFLSQILLKHSEQIKSQINTRESKQFYVCENCNIELTGEKALLYNFTCNECGEIFKLKDNSKLLKELKKNLDKIKNKLFSINEEKEKEKEKIEKQKNKENKKLDEERAKEARKNKLAKRNLAKKELKKVNAIKKKVKKRKK